MDNDVREKVYCGGVLRMDGWTDGRTEGGMTE